MKTIKENWVTVLAKYQLEKKLREKGQVNDHRRVNTPSTLTTGSENKKSQVI